MGGTLLGSALTYVFQRRSVERLAHEFWRQLRTERLAASGATYWQATLGLNGVNERQDRNGLCYLTYGVTVDNTGTC